MSYGIAAVGSVLGEPLDVAAHAGAYTKDMQRIRDWGYRTFHRADDRAGLTDLAVEAGRRAMDKAGITAEDVDLVVLAMSDVPEYLYWDAAAACQAGLGALNAEALLVNQACSAGVMAFDAVAGKFATHPEYRVALLVAANRVCEQYRNRMESDTSVTSDGAAAAVLVRDHPASRWLTTQIMSDGRYAHLFRLPGGGAAQPFSPSNPDPGILVSPFDRMEEHFGTDVPSMLAFVRQIRRNNREVVERACARASVSFGDVRRVLHVNENIRALRKFAEDLDLPLERTNADIAMEHGHLGSADQIHAFGTLLDERRLAPGDVVALTSTGTGMHWTCTLVRA